MQEDADLPRGVLHPRPPPRGEVPGTEEEAAREGVPGSVHEARTARAHRLLQEQQLGPKVRKGNCLSLHRCQCVSDSSRHTIPNCSSRHCLVEEAILDYARENLVMFNIFIKDPYAKRFQKDEKITITSYIANSGGLLGLCMGFSLISGAEIIFHAAFGLFSMFVPRARLWNDERRRDSRDSDEDEDGDDEEENNGRDRRTTSGSAAGFASLTSGMTADGRACSGIGRAPPTRLGPVRHCSHCRCRDFQLQEADRQVFVRPATLLHQRHNHSQPQLQALPPPPPPSAVQPDDRQYYVHSQVHPPHHLQHHHAEPPSYYDCATTGDGGLGVGRHHPHQMSSVSSATSSSTSHLHRIGGGEGGGGHHHRHYHVINMPAEAASETATLVPSRQNSLGSLTAVGAPPPPPPPGVSSSDMHHQCSSAAGSLPTPPPLCATCPGGGASASASGAPAKDNGSSGGGHVKVTLGPERII